MMLAMWPWLTSLDNGTDIASLTTTWGEDDAYVVYEDQATGVLLFFHHLTKKKLRTLELAFANIPDRKGVPRAANARLRTY